MQKIKFMSAVIVLALIMPSSTYAGWFKTYGGSGTSKAHAIQQTADGGYIVAGETEAFGNGGKDVWVLKLNSDGTVAWQKTFGGSNDDVAYSVCQTLDRLRYVVAGYTRSFGYGGSDFWVIILNSDGSLVQQRNYGRSDADRAYCIRETADGGFIVAGRTSSYGTGFSDVLVLKLYSYLSVEWEFHYGRPGSNYQYVPKCVEVTTDGQYVVAGWVHLDTTVADASGFALKLDPTGSLVWQNTYGDSVSDSIECVSRTSDGGFIAAGIHTGGGDVDLWVLKMYASGAPRWQKTYGLRLISSSYDKDGAVQQTTDGGYIVAASDYYDLAVLKLDSNGNVSWAKTYDSVHYVSSVQQTADGGYIIAGESGGGDVAVLKLDDNGEISGCPYMGNGQTSVSSTDVISQPRTTAVGSTSVFNTSTTASPRNTSASVSVLCETPTPTVSISANPASIVYGDSSTLSWSSTNATSATLDPGFGSVAVNGSLNVSPAETTTYTITVTGPGGTATDSVTVTVTDITAEWTVMVYLDGDNDLEAFAIGDLNEMEMVGSDENVNIVVQIDRHPGYDSSNGNWTTCRRYYVTHDTDPNNINSTLIAEAEVNMGDPQTLRDFATWAINNYPAEKYMLVLWDHGSGWKTLKAMSGDEPPPLKAVCYDDSSGGDALTNADLKSALSNILSSTALSKIDCLGFDACLMQMMEVAYDVRNYASYMIGSEEIEWADGWEYDQFLGQLVNYPSATPKQLATAVVNTYQNRTLSAIDLTTVVYLTSRVNNFAHELILHHCAYCGEITGARSSSQEYSDDDYIDLYDFSSRITQYPVPASLITAGQDVMNAVNTSVVANKVTIPNSYGVSIYYPEDCAQYNSNYSNLGFAAATQWDDFISSVCCPTPPTCECDFVPDSTVVARGETLGFEATVTNNTSLNGTAWFGTKITLPSGALYPASGWLKGPYELNFSPDETKTGDLLQYIPDSAPLGSYTYHGYVGRPGNVFDECQFNFEVTQPVETNVNIYTSPGTIVEGEWSTLSWSSTNADSATIDQGIGTVPVNGSYDVSPTETTTYTITVTGPGGTATDSVTVTVTWARAEARYICFGSVIHPDIDGNTIVWRDSRNGNPDIYMFDLTTDEERAICTAPGYQSYPGVSGNKIVWDDGRSGRDIYMYNLSTGQERAICTNSLEQMFPEISGNRIVWSDFRNGAPDIYMYDLSTGQERAICTAAGTQYWPHIDGNKIVWEDYRNGNYDIYMYDLSTGQQRAICTNGAEQRYPRVSGNTIIWEDYRNGNADIYMYDLRTNQQGTICTNSADQWGADIDGNKVTWLDKRNGSFGDIYLYDLDKQKEARLYSPIYNPQELRISGNRIAFLRGGYGQSYVYMLEVIESP